MKTAKNSEDVASGEYDAARAYESLCYAVVCHRKEIDPQSALAAAFGPSGTSNGWQFLERDELPDAWWDGAPSGRETPYPQPCHGAHPDTHVHSVGAA